MALPMFYRRLTKWWMLAFAGFFLPFTAQAFTMTPALTDIALDPGVSQSGKVTIGNDENVPQTFYISIQKFIPAGESGQQTFLPPSDTSGLPNWISFDRPSFTLRSGESRQLTYVVNVPRDAAPGGYYAVVFFSNVPPDAQGTNVSIGARTGMLVFVTVKGAFVEQAFLKDFALETPSRTDRLPATFRVSLQNVGNVHILPEGTLSIRNVFGNTVARLPLNQLKNRIMPNSERRFLVSWYKETPEAGKGFWHDAKEEWNNFAVGPYRATLEIASPKTNGFSAQTLSFWVLPWRLGVLLVIGLFVLVAVGRLHRRWVIARATRA